MDRNRLLALLILILIVGGTAFWVLWGIVLNKGTVVFVFPRPPFTVSITEEAKTCLLNECEFRVPVGPRSYTIEKDGYYSRTGSVNIKRGEKITENISLEFIPQAAEGKERTFFALPVGYSKFLPALQDISLFAEYRRDITLKGLPKIIDNILFAPSATKALVFEDSELAIYMIEDSTLKSLAGINDPVSAVFSADESHVYAVSYDARRFKHILTKTNIREDEDPEMIVDFGRDITDCALSVSKNDSLLALVDSTFSPANVYIIDLNEKTRANIFTGYRVKAGRWSGSGEVFVFEGRARDEDFTALYYYSAATQTVEKMAVNAPASNIDFFDTGAVVVTSQKYTIANYSVPYIVNFQPEPVGAASFQQTTGATALQQGAEATALQQGAEASALQQGAEATALQQGAEASALQQGAEATTLQQLSDTATLQPATDTTALQPATDSHSVLARWDFKTNQFYLIKDLSGVISGIPQKIEASPDGRAVKMLIGGLVYEIRIQE